MRLNPFVWPTVILALGSREVGYFEPWHHHRSHFEHILVNDIILKAIKIPSQIKNLIDSAKIGSHICIFHS